MNSVALGHSQACISSRSSLSRCATGPWVPSGRPRQGSGPHHPLHGERYIGQGDSDGMETTSNYLHGILVHGRSDSNLQPGWAAARIS